MKRKGIRFRKAKHLGYRHPQEGDTYLDGTSIGDNYVVIVRIEECETYEKDGRLVYDPADAPIIELSGHSRTNMVYGSRRTYRNKNYDTRTVYWVEDGIVYRGSINIEMEPEDQPEEGWYDSYGRYYKLKMKNLSRDDSILATQDGLRPNENNIEFLSRPSREGDGYDVYGRLTTNS